MTTPNPEQLVIRANDLEQDHLSRARSSQFIGQVLLNPEVYIEPVEEPDYVNLLEAMQGATRGDSEGAANVRINAHIATVEAIYKAGHVTRVKTTFRHDGSVAQHGQSMMNTYRNSLLFTGDSAPMQRRVRAETLNGHRIEDLKRSGLLEDYWLFVPSLYPDDMTDKEATKNGFFSDTKTAALQATTSQGNVCITESAFVAGVAQPEGARHDLDAIKALYQTFGFDTRGMTASDFLESPLLVHKSLMPAGIVDLVRLFDDFADGKFFGQNKQRRNYVDFMLECQNREARLHDTVNEVSSELIQQVDELDKPIDAVERLYKIVKKKVIEQAVSDKSIDARIFGNAAYEHILQARQLMDRGYAERAGQEIDLALRVAKVTMCGIGGINGQSTGEKDNSSETKIEKDCDYISKQCPLCHTKNARTHETKYKISCKECKGSVLKKPTSSTKAA